VPEARDVNPSVPSVVTHYYLRHRPPFLNLSDLGEDKIETVLSTLSREHASGTNHRRFGRTYLRMREATEDRLRELFMASGGRPERRHPHYFVLGTSKWFAGLSPDMDSITLPVSALPSTATSITYTDSFTALGIVADFGLPYERKAHHGRVFRLEDIAELVGTYGMPHDAADEDYTTYVNGPFEHFIEVQLWTDEPIRQFLLR